jgi:hypothetical protein
MSDCPSAPEDLADVWGSAARWTFMFGLARCAPWRDRQSRDSDRPLLIAIAQAQKVYNVLI